MIILGNRWVQGYGFDKNHISHSMFDTRVKAMNRLKKAKAELDKAELEDWYILATIDRVGDRYEMIAQIKEIV